MSPPFSFSPFPPFSRCPPALPPLRALALPLLLPLLSIDDSTNSAVAGVVGVSAADEVWLAVDAREREARQREEDAGSGAEEGGSSERDRQDKGGGGGADGTNR